MDWTYTITIPSTQAPLPLRQLLSTWLIPKHLIHDLRISQRVLVNGAYRSMNQLVTAGDTVHLTFLPADFAEPFPDVDPDSAATVAVLYETTDLLIINKTRGSKTHPNQPGERGTTLNHVAAYLGDDQPGPYILSRLDQETTGALMMTKTPAVVPIMSVTLLRNACNGPIWPGFTVSSLGVAPLPTPSAVILEINVSAK